MRRFILFGAVLLFASCKSTVEPQPDQKPVPQAPHSYTVTPSNTMHVDAPVNKLTIFDIYQENLDSLPISLGWRKLELNIPPEWDYSMCELGRCYAGIPDSSQMDDVAPHNKAFLGLNIIPNGKSGTGTVRCIIFDVRYPAQRDTFTWYVTAG